MDSAVLDAVSRELLTTLTWSRGPAGRGDPATKPRKYSRALLAGAPVAFRASHLDPRARLRIAILPLTNLTDDVSAATVVGARMLAALQGRRELSLVDPGELRRALIDGNIRPLDGVGPPQLESLRDALGIDALLDGTLLRFDPGGADAPRIDLFVRLRDAGTGAVLWSATTSRGGDETRTFFDAGRIRDPDRLAEAVVADLLSTWFR